jgi:hypothetical protein
MTNCFTYYVQLARINGLFRRAATGRLAREARQAARPQSQTNLRDTETKGDDMSEPFIFVTEHTVKGGRREDLERLTGEFVEFVDANEPRIVAIGAYLSDGTWPARRSTERSMS